MGSELPEARPSAADEDLTWATTSGARGIGPAPAKKATGWLHEEAPAHDFFNWWQGMIGDVFAWLTANVVRTFDSLSEGIAQTSPGDTFRLKRAVAIDGDTNAIPVRAFAPNVSFGVEFGVMCTDGLRLYVQDPDNDGIRAYRTDDIASGNEVWIQEGLAGYSGINRIDTDGDLVVVVRDDDGATANIHILDASNGNIVAEFTSTGTDDALDCFAASQYGIRRVFWCETSRLMQWTVASGAVAFVAVAGAIHAAVCVGPDYIHLATLGASSPSAGFFRTYDGVGTLQGTAHAMTDAASVVRLATDGEHLFAATWDGDTPDYPTFYKLGLLEASTWTAPSTWSGKYSATTDAPLRPDLRVDDRFVYVNDEAGVIYALSKESGHIVYGWSAIAHGDFCVDGDRLYAISVNKIYSYQARMRPPGSLWARVASGGTAEDDGLGGCNRTPFRNLALPL